MENQYQACLLPIPESPLVARLLGRISELEDENSNLRRLEETIRTNNYLFEALLQGSHDGIILLTPGLNILRLIHSVLGYSEADLLGEPLLSFVHPDHVPAFQQQCADLLNGQSRASVVEVQARNPTGDWTWLEMQLTDMLDDPRVQAIVVHSRRIAEPPEFA